MATVCVIAMIIVKFHQKMRKSSTLYAMFQPLDSFIEKLARYTEPTAYLASIGGVVGLVVSSFVGFYVWSAEALTSSSLGLNKVMFTIFSTELWILFIIIRSGFGEELWKNRGLAAIYVCAGFGGFFFMVLTGSLGGHMALGVSVLDPIYELLKVNPEAFWIVGFDLVPALIAVVLIGIVAFFAVLARKRTRS